MTLQGVHMEDDDPTISYMLQVCTSEHSVGPLQDLNYLRCINDLLQNISTSGGCCVPWKFFAR
jgi:hypothetical protein